MHTILRSVASLAIQNPPSSLINRLRVVPGPAGASAARVDREVSQAAVRDPGTETALEQDRASAMDQGSATAMEPDQD